MALSIRLSRGGSKKRPYYRIVVADARSPRDGKFIERIGSYNPLLPKDNAERVKLDTDRAKHWLSVGAQPTDRVARFLDDARAAGVDGLIVVDLPPEEDEELCLPALAAGLAADGVDPDGLVAP